MLALTGGIRIYLWRGPTDMRKSYDSLAAIVQHHMKADPYDGSLYVFCNRHRNRVKILYWDRDGYALWSKRLEKGRFLVPSVMAEKQRVDPGDLMLLLEGIVPAKRGVRYKRPVETNNYDN